MPGKDYVSTQLLTIQMAVLNDKSSMLSAVSLSAVIIQMGGNKMNTAFGEKAS